MISRYREGELVVEAMRWELLMTDKEKRHFTRESLAAVREAVDHLEGNLAGLEGEKLDDTVSASLSIAGWVRAALVDLEKRSKSKEDSNV